MKQRIYSNTLKFLHRVEAGEVPQILQNQMTQRQEAHDHNLRNIKDYQLPNSRSAFAQNSLFYKGMQLFNDFKRTCGDEYQTWGKTKIKNEISNFVNSKLTRE